MRLDRELLKGVTETAALAALAAAPAHGYELVRRLRRDSEGIFQFGEGTLYPLLYKLEAGGWICSDWHGGQGQRRRRIYRITPSGQARLTSRTRQWRDVVRAMSLILQEPTHVPA